jgi:hypothetical protein
VEVATKEIGVSVTLAGITLGNIYGNLNDGVGIDINLLVAKGSLRFYLKNGNEVWIHFDVSIVFDGSYKDDVKILTI